MIKIFKYSVILNKLNNSVYFEEFYCLILSVIAILLWKFAGEFSVAVIVGIAAISLFIFNDFKYMIPCVLNFIFSFNQGLTMQSFPLPLIISGVVFITILIAFMILNGFHIKKAKSCIGIIGLSISCFIPIFWNRQIIPEDSPVLYFLYFTYALYLILYLVFVSSLKENSFRMTCIAFSYAAILIACECIWKVYDMHIANPDSNFLTFWYYIGWGLCNEAGIMMITFIPATFLLIVKSKTLPQLIFNILKLVLIPFGMLLTTSRGTMLFGVLEFILLGITSLFLANKKWSLLTIYVVLISTILLFVQFKYGIVDLSKTIIYAIFDRMNHEGTLIEKIISALNPNGRSELWNDSLIIWNDSKFFGKGIVNSIYWANQPNGEWGLVYVVFHSTVFECLASFGIVGCLFMVIHFLEKYLSLSTRDKTIMYIIGFGYFIIDVYGLIDNTYGMWYYMIPLMIIMGSLDCIKSKSSKENFNIY